MNKKLLYAFSILLNLVLLICIFLMYKESHQSKQYSYTNKYTIDNSNYKKSGDKDSVLFIGNSITENWIHLRPSFFRKNKFLNRGLGGQTSTQILLRFQQDVINLNPKIVVLNTGTNDIAESDGFYSKDYTLSNIQTMIDICRANKVKIILSSVLPAHRFKPNRFTTISNVSILIDSLNISINELATNNSVRYVDYNTMLRNDDGNFNKKFTFDGVHPNEEGYIIMENLILQAINNTN